MTLLEAVRRGSASLEAAGAAPDAARRDAMLLARHVLGWDAAQWLTRQSAPAPTPFEALFAALVGRRARHEPIAYLTGEREFYGRTFRVTRDVLIPRPETEDLVTAALERLPAGSDRPRHVLDVGTGSGCVAITIALEHAGCQVTATDISAAALEVARENARRLAPNRAIVFQQIALAGGLIDRVDVLVSNPPYVAARDRRTLAPDVADFEPHTALFGGDDGLEVIGALVLEAVGALKADGWLLMEIGHDQAAAVETLVRRAGLLWRGTRADLAGHPRIALAQRAPRSV